MTAIVLTADLVIYVVMVANFRHGRISRRSFTVATILFVAVYIVITYLYNLHHAPDIIPISH